LTFYLLLLTCENRNS